MVKIEVNVKCAACGNEGSSSKRINMLKMHFHITASMLSVKLRALLIDSPLSILPYARRRGGVETLCIYHGYLTSACPYNPRNGDVKAGSPQLGHRRRSAYVELPSCLRRDVMQVHVFSGLNAMSFRIPISNAVIKSVSRQKSGAWRRVLASGAGRNGLRYDTNFTSSLCIESSVMGLIRSSAHEAFGPLKRVSEFNLVFAPNFSSCRDSIIYPLELAVFQSWRDLKALRGGVSSDSCHITRRKAASSPDDGQGRGGQRGHCRLERHGFDENFRMDTRTKRSGLQDWI